MTKVVIRGFLVALAVGVSVPVAAQSTGPRFAAAGQLAGATSSEFDDADLGFGGLFIWHPAGARFLATEAETNIYPSKLAAGRGAPYSRRRIEGLFGATIGPTFGRVRPIAKFRPGFVWIEKAPGVLACPAIYPPSCHANLPAANSCSRPMSVAASKCFRAREQCSASISATA